MNLKNKNKSENLSIDQLVNHLIFAQKVEKGLDDSLKGRVHSKDEARQKLNKWLK